MSPVDVVAAGAALEPKETPVPTGPTSPLDLLRGKRPALQEKLFLDLAVPRWDEQLPGRKLWVRYRPGNPALFSAALARRERENDEAQRRSGRGDPDWSVKANADVLVDACVAVYDLPADEHPPEGELPPGDYPTFGSEGLSDALGTSHNAVETALSLYVTKGDLLLAASQLMNWSGQTSEEVTQGFLAR